MKKKKADTVNMFASSAQDLPIFSGTAPRAQAPRPPKTQRRQANLFTNAGACPACNGTGTVKLYKNKPPRRCICSAANKGKGN